jgi:alpha-L-rhamnosidase
MILGVQPASPGFKVANIRPAFQLLKEADGSVVTPYGLIKVRWNPLSSDNSTSSDNPEVHRVRLSVEAPEGVTVKLSPLDSNDTGNMVTFEGKYEDVFKI